MADRQTVPSFVVRVYRQLVLVGETAPPHSHLFSVSINEGYRATSLIRNPHPPRITMAARATPRQY